MIIRQLKQCEYDRLHQSLMQKAYTEPLDASYTVTMFVNSEEYFLKIQPENHRKIAVLQALQIRRTEDGPEFLLVTEGRLLTSLLELLIYQGVSR